MSDADEHLETVLRAADRLMWHPVPTGLPENPTEVGTMLSDTEFEVPIVKNAVTCGICGCRARRYASRFQCVDNRHHIGDLNVGIFSDLTPP